MKTLRASLIDLICHKVQSLGHSLSLQIDMQGFVCRKYNLLGPILWKKVIFAENWNTRFDPPSNDMLKCYLKFNPFNTKTTLSLSHILLALSFLHHQFPVKLAPGACAPFAPPPPCHCFKSDPRGETVKLTCIVVYINSQPINFWFTINMIIKLNTNIIYERW